VSLLGPGYRITRLKFLSIKQSVSLCGPGYRITRFKFLSIKQSVSLLGPGYRITRLKFLSIKQSVSLCGPGYRITIGFQIIIFKTGEKKRTKHRNPFAVGAVIPKPTDCTFSHSTPSGLCFNIYITTGCTCGYSHSTPTGLSRVASYCVWRYLVLAFLKLFF
jgi:hypothetical protein